MRARIDDVESHGRIGSAGYAEFSRIREERARGLRGVAEQRSGAHRADALDERRSSTSCWAASRSRPGDEIVTTDNEHAGLLEPLAALTRRYGVVVRVAEALQSADPLDAIAAQIGPRTKVVALSHVLWANGRILPLREIAEAAHAAGAPLLVDGAQGVGAIDVDPAALGADAYAGPGQKWLCGPNGVGFLWLADGFEERFEVAAAELLHARLPQRGRAVLAGRAPARRRVALHGRARRPDRRRRVPARARGLVRGRGGDGGRARPLRRSC